MTEVFNDAPILLILGIMFLLGFAAHLAGRHTKVPRVTLLILGGLAIGPSGFKLLPTSFVEEWFPILTTMALSLVGFLLGQQMSLKALKKRGKLVMSITLGETSGAILAVGASLLVLGIHPVAVILLAGISAATAPAATFDIVRESKAKGEFPDTLLAVVAIDDAWALFMFSLLMAAASTFNGDSSAMASLWHGLQEIGGSLLLGALLGAPMAYLTGRIRKGEPTLAEAMGFVLVCGGAATWLDLSPVLSTMIMGSIVASLASHHKRPFHAIEDTQWPILLLFFILAGASAHIDALISVGAITLTYIVFRCIGSYSGAWLGASLAGADQATRRYLGLGLFPQAGVALGMTLMASQRFPEFASILLPTVLASTIIYELVTPVITRKALKAAQAMGN